MGQKNHTKLMAIFLSNLNRFLFIHYLRYFPGLQKLFHVFIHAELFGQLLNSDSDQVY